MVLVSTKYRGDADWPELSLHLGGDFPFGPGGPSTLKIPHPGHTPGLHFSWGDQLAGGSSLQTCS